MTSVMTARTVRTAGHGGQGVAASRGAGLASVGWSSRPAVIWPQRQSVRLEGMTSTMKRQFIPTDHEHVYILTEGNYVRHVAVTSAGASEEVIKRRMDYARIILAGFGEDVTLLEMVDAHAWLAEFGR